MLRVLPTSMSIMNAGVFRRRGVSKGTGDSVLEGFEMGPRTTLEGVLGVEGMAWALDKVVVVGRALSMAGSAASSRAGRPPMSMLTRRTPRTSHHIASSWRNHLRCNVTLMLVSKFSMLVSIAIVF